MPNLRPSPALTVSEHTSIGETIQTLIDHKVGSVIVTSYSAPHKIIGIFTERDLLKWVFDFKDNNQWNVAIGTVMTKKPIKLSILELDQANEVMLKNNIRHLPIVYHDDDGEEHLAGMISMRDAFRALVDENNILLKKLGAFTSSKNVLVLAKNPLDQQLQKKVLSGHVDFKLLEEDFDQELKIEKLLEPVLASDVFIFDLDHLSVSFWPIFLKKILDSADHPDVFLVFNPVLHEKKNIDAIMTIAAGKAVHAFPKPVSLLQYLTQIEKSMKA